ncbi:MAG: hypothetical protein AB1Z98_03260 [Nannocystaceae bacterium]
MNRAFLRSLHEEHLEEIAALYERRFALLDDTEIDHEDIADLEARLEAHLDALVVGGEPALQLCAERALDADAGELFGALCLLCRQGRYDLFEAALVRFEDEEHEGQPPPPAAPESSEDDEDELPLAEMLSALASELKVESPPDEDEDEDEPGDDEEDEDEDEDEDEQGPSPAQALGDALCTEAPVAWQGKLVALLEQAPSSVVGAVARMAAARGLRIGPAIVAAAPRVGSGPSMAAVLWALGRTREREAVSLLSDWARALQRDEAPVATLALLRFGDPAMLDFLARAASTHSWALSMLAIAGGPTVAPIIHARLARPEATAEEIVAAGLFGDPVVVAPLLGMLGGSHSEAVVEALYLVTGAALFETVLEPVVEVDAMEPLPNGEPDPRDHVEVQRLSQDPEAWTQWWSEHASAFTAGRRYRLGQLASPEVLGATVHRFVLSRAARQLAADEVGLRYWPQRDLDVDQWAPQQQAALAGLPALRDGDAVIARSDGAWVFARALMR